jgi:hypothetical protein
MIGYLISETLAMNQPKTNESTAGPVLAIVAMLLPIGLFYLIAEARNLELRDFAKHAPLVLGGIGAIIAVTRRSTSRKRRGEKSLLFIIASDYSFDHYATLSILTLLYSVIQGACFGASLAFALLALLFRLTGAGMAEPFLVGLGCSLLTVVVARLSIEGYTVIYRTAQDLGDFLRKQASQTCHSGNDKDK